MIRALLLSLSCLLCLPLLFTEGCSQTVCTADTSCGDGQTCQAGKCVSPEVDGGLDASSSEPPPYPDTDWKDGSFAGPESFVEKTAQAVGTRKEGETCNPEITAIAQDRCADGMLCVAPYLRRVGLCMKSCTPDAATCGAGKRCGPVYSVDTGKALGHACGVAVEVGERCTFGRYCKDGFYCSAINGKYDGVCLKTCKDRSECDGGKGWCDEAKPFLTEDSKQQVCVALLAYKGARCVGPVLCGSGLTCVEGSRPTCRLGCDQRPCPTGETCVATKDSKGNTLYSACYPVVPVGGHCGTGFACEGGSACVGFSQPTRMLVCMKDCTKDAQVCGTGGTCVELSSGRKVCYAFAKEGALCDGPTRCESGLRCVSFKAGEPRHCVKDCTADASTCGSTQRCHKVGKIGDKETSLCLEGCDSNDPKATCTWSAFACEAVGGGVCMPNSSTRTGKKKRNEACQAHPAALEAERCEQGLTCTDLDGEWRCLKLCDVSAPDCGAESCLVLSSLGRAHCGKAGKEGDGCDLGQGLYCAQGLRCQRRVSSLVGRCVKETMLTEGQLCSSDTSPCGENLLCAGDPVTPYRWSCRARCDNALTCKANQVCMTLQEGAACFETCQKEGDICDDKIHLCQKIQERLGCF